jgi:hypothetical protein
MIEISVAAFIVVAIAVLSGSALGVMHLQSEGRTAPPFWLAALHVIFGIGGLGCLVLALRGPTRGLDQAFGFFGVIAAALIALTALLGAGFIVTRLRKRRPAGILIGIHATLAVSGFVILAAYVFAG